MVLKNLEHIMKSTLSLPEGFVKTDGINLESNKKQLLVVAIIQLVVIALTVAMGVLLSKSSPMVQYDGESLLVGDLIAKIVVIILGSVAYVICHELIHGLFFKIFVPKCKLNFGVSFKYAYCGSNAYYTKKTYVVIGLAPVVVFFVVFLLLNLLLVKDWFWPIYGLQIFNLAGASGDFFVTAKLLSDKREFLLLDNGFSIDFFVKKER